MPETDDRLEAADNNSAAVNRRGLGLNPIGKRSNVGHLAIAVEIPMAISTDVIGVEDHLARRVDLRVIRVLLWKYGKLTARIDSTRTMSTPAGRY